MNNAQRIAFSASALGLLACGESLQTLQINETACLYFTDGTSQALTIVERLRVSPGMTPGEIDFIKGIKRAQGRDLASIMLDKGVNATKEERAIPADTAAKVFARVLPNYTIKAGQLSVKPDKDTRCPALQQPEPAL